jgi:hypothetical protein
MPAHIGISKYLEHGMAYISQFSPVATGMGKTYRGFRSTRKGRALLTRGMSEDEAEDSHRKFVRPDVASYILHREHEVRTIRCDTYDAYRSALDSNYAPATAQGSERFAERDISLGKTHSLHDPGWDRERFLEFKGEWTLYLQAGTAFDQTVGYFLKQGWYILLIRGKSGTDGKRFSELKRIEAFKSRMKVVILWSYK